MSLHESRGATAAEHEMDVTTNIEAVASGMEWDQEDTKQNEASASAAAAAASHTEEYQLSAQLTGHDYGVRDVSSSGGDTIVSIEEKGRANVFLRNGPTSWQVQEGIEAQIHNSLAFVIANVEGCKMRGTAFPALSDHGGPVNSISSLHPSRLVVTGSWDGIVRVWHGSELVGKFDKLGHEHGTEVLGLESGPIVTASTTKHIVIIDEHGKVLQRIANAHGAPIRKLVTHPLGFASAANDGVVKVWTADGQLVQTIDAATNSEVKFLYGLCFISSDHPLSAGVDLDRTRLVTSGEDGYVRVFDAAGKLVQELIHPGPVRSVHPLGLEGDFLTACADKKVRIFTRAANRFATEKERSEFKEMGQLVKASGMKALDTSTLENETALATPGTKNGQVKVLNISGRPVPIAYQWSADLQEWIEIGEAMGASGSNGPTKAKSKIDGVEYDFVSDVWLDEQNKVQLGFNADDDPEEVTTRFCSLYQIPSDMRQQILEFITPKVDMAAVIRRKELAAQPTNRIVLHQVPSWTSGSFETYPQANLQAMEKKINETNATLAQQGHPFALTSVDDVRSMRLFFDNIRDVTSYHSALFTAGEQSVFKKMLQWPTENILPIMDAMRVLMMHGAANTALGGDAQVQNILIDHTKVGTALGKETYQILLFKIMSNWIAKRTRSQSERFEVPSAPPTVVEYIARVADEFADAAGKESENLVLAYLMFLHNVICWFGRLKVAESPLYPQVASGLCELLNHKRNSKIQFYALLTIGSIACASPAARNLLRSTFSDPFTAFIHEAARADNLALKQVANDCKLLYQLQ